MSLLGGKGISSIKPHTEGEPLNPAPVLPLPTVPNQHRGSNSKALEPSLSLKAACDLGVFTPVWGQWGIREPGLNP